MASTAPAQSPESDASLGGARDWFRRHNLSRPRKPRLLGGVASAFARRFGTSLLLARLLAVASAIFVTPLLYVALWILLPSDE
jgi:phage shock protein PspC (stress-responsive transcriptional regulator)